MGNTISSIKVKVKKSALIRLEPANLAYVQHHRIEINGNTFLFLNCKNVFYINSCEKEYKFSKLGSLLVKLCFRLENDKN